MKYIVVTFLFVLGFGCKSEVPVANADSPKNEKAVEAAAAKKEVKKAVKAEKKTEAKPLVATAGKPAPDFTAKDQDGKEYKLADLKGSVVVLEWTAPACPYVKRHYKAKTMTNTFKAFPAGKVKWLAIDSSHSLVAAESAAWRKAEGFTYPVLQDKDGKLGKTYGAKTTPHMYVIDAEGVLRYSGAIDDNPHGDKTEGINNYVSASVNALLAGKEPAKSSTSPYGCSVKYARR